MAIAGSARDLCWMAKIALAGVPVLLRGLMRSSERSLATGLGGVSAKALVRELTEGPGHRPIPVCPVRNCEKLREAATMGRSGVRRCDGRIFPGDGRCDEGGWSRSCEQRSPSLRVVRGPRGAGLGCKEEVRRREGQRSSWGRTLRRSAQRFRRWRRIRSVRAGDQRRARWQRGNRE